MRSILKYKPIVFVSRGYNPSSRKKMEIENDNRLRVSRQKKKEIMNQKMRVENGD